MAKVSKVQSKDVWGFNELLPILQDAFRVLHLSYLNLYSTKKGNKYTKPLESKKWYLEDIITNDLIKGTAKIEKIYSYRLQKQQEDFETNSKIDIAVLYSLKFGDNSNDLKIECKRLDNLSYIINDGIESFKQNKYAEKLSLAGMLLYNMENEIKENITALSTKIAKTYSNREVLNQTRLIENLKFSYKSNHTRTNNSTLNLYSCVFDYKDIIEKQ